MRQKKGGEKTKMNHIAGIFISVGAVVLTYTVGILSWRLSDKSSLHLLSISLNFILFLIGYYIILKLKFGGNKSEYKRNFKILKCS